MTDAMPHVMRLCLAVTTRPGHREKTLTFPCCRRGLDDRSVASCEQAWQYGGRASRSASTTREGHPGACCTVSFMTSAPSYESPSLMITTRGDTSAFCTFAADDAISSAFSGHSRASAFWIRLETRICDEFVRVHIDPIPYHAQRGQSI